MDELDLVRLFVRPLERAGIAYMISGSLASMHYGEPRLTLDVDLVLHLSEAELAKLPATFPEESYYLPPLDVLTIEVTRSSRGHFNVIHFETGMKADCYPSRSHPYWEWAWKNRKSTPTESHPLWFAPPEYVIVRKLEFYQEGGSEKHIQDIQSMLDLSMPNVDLPWIEIAVAERGLSEEWAQIAPG